MESRGKFFWGSTLCLLAVSIFIFVGVNSDLSRVCCGFFGTGEQALISCNPSVLPTLFRSAMNASNPGDVDSAIFGYRGFPASQRIAVIIRGESFRRGRNEKCILSQLNASRSHILNVVEPILSLGYGVDVFLQTYKTPAVSRLLDVYRDFTVYADVFAEMNRTNADNEFSQAQFTPFFRLLIKLIDARRYTGYLIIRFDMVFKQSLLESCSGLRKAAVSDSKILFSFQISKKFGDIVNGTAGSAHPRVGDYLHWVPSALAQPFVASLNLPGYNTHGHGHAWWPKLAAHPNITLSGMGFCMTEQFDADPKKEANSMYYSISRPEFNVSRNINVCF